MTVSFDSQNLPALLFLLSLRFILPDCIAVLLIRLFLISDCKFKVTVEMVENCLLRVRSKFNAGASELVVNLPLLSVPLPFLACI